MAVRCRYNPESYKWLHLNSYMRKLSKFSNWKAKLHAEVQKQQATVYWQPKKVKIIKTVTWSQNLCKALPKLGRAVCLIPMRFRLVIPAAADPALIIAYAKICKLNVRAIVKHHQRIGCMPACMIIIKHDITLPDPQQI